MKVKLVGAEPFKYTDEQQAEIKQMLQCLDPTEAEIEETLKRLEAAARNLQYRLLRGEQDKAAERRWAKITNLMTEAEDLLRPHSDYPPRCLLELQQLLADAIAYRQAYGAGRSKRKTMVRILFQFHVLECWVRIGGALQFSRNQKVGGPLARYFSAAVAPVMDISLESLPDIVERARPRMSTIRSSEPSAIGSMRPTTDEWHEWATKHLIGR
jgi:hypothetical protein